jgi:hypothetical protein
MGVFLGSSPREGFYNNKWGVALELRNTGGAVSSIQRKNEDVLTAKIKTWPRVLARCYNML